VSEIGIGLIAGANGFAKTIYYCYCLIIYVPGVSGTSNGAGNVATFNTPIGLTLDSAGRYIYVADNQNNLIRRVDLSTTDYNVISLPNSVDTPFGIVIDSSDSILYVTSQNLNSIYKVSLGDNSVTLFAGSGSSKLTIRKFK
jgi:DNA-binding beta-propeller fold protein YncE